jgi:hypothetical protein
MVYSFPDLVGESYLKVPQHVVRNRVFFYAFKLFLLLLETLQCHNFLTHYDKACTCRG